MSDKLTLAVGGSHAYSTRATGLNTWLSIESHQDDDKSWLPGSAVWHIELCCQDDHSVTVKEHELQKINISGAAGALVTVRNEGDTAIDCWTDY